MPPADARLLDLGCGDGPRKRDGYECYGVDVAAAPRVEAADLAWEPIPFGDGAFDRVVAYDFLEHVPMRAHVDGRTRNCMVELFNEIHRVLVTGGVFESFTPHLFGPPNMALQEVFRDPTHVSVWVEQSWDYWTGAMADLMRRYGYRAEFRIARKERRRAHLYVELEKQQGGG